MLSDRTKRITSTGDETELEMVNRHIREGDRHIVKQRALVARLKQDELPIEEAERLLSTFEGVQRLHQDHLVRILDRQI